jgi:hypothetical protein
LSFIVQEPSGIIRPVERDVAIGKPAQVAQHLGFAVIPVESRVGQESGCAQKRRRQRAR